MTGFAPNEISFSTVYCATLPLPETRQILPFKIFLARLEHFVREINRAVSGRLRTNDRAAPGQTFAGHDAGEFVPQSLVHSEQESDLARADADVARRARPCPARCAGTART